MVASTFQAETSPAWTWRSYPCGAGREEVLSGWEDLVARSRAGFLASPAWVDCFIRAFARGDGGVAVHLLFSDRECVAAIPLRLHAGVVRRLEGLDNEHWPYWAIAIDTSVPGVARRVIEHLLELSDVLDLRGLHQSSPAHQALRSAAFELGLRVDEDTPPKGDTAFHFPSSWESCQRMLSRHLQRDLRQGKRRLDLAGRLGLEVETGGPNLDAVLSECFDLEARGWKGSSGSPIRAVEETLRFYRELAQAAARRGALAIYQLRLDGKLIAFEYCLRHEGRIELLKISYDPEWSKVSPGTVLRGMLWEHEIQRGEMRSYHLGRQSEWKLRWTEQVLPLANLRIYGRGWRGQFASLGAKQLTGGLRRLAIVRTASRWMRSVVHALPF